MARITNYKRHFNSIINNASNEFAGCVEVFNYIANSRFFEHMALEELPSGGYSNGERNPWTPTTIEELCSELWYWLTCYYECGNIRHDEEYADRTMLIRGLEALKPRCNWSEKNEHFSAPVEIAC